VIELINVDPERQGKKIIESSISFTLAKGQIAVILGSSGVGKTTLLDCIRGSAKFNGKINGIENIFSVFQGEDQLFPWYTIRKNFELASCSDVWITLSKKWHIDHLIDRKPTDMSGGQRQRFVLLRALTKGANLLLCDEPLNHLDMLSSKIIAQDFQKIVKDTGTSVIWITHDCIEAKILSDRCYMLTKQGLIEINNNDIRIEHVSKFLDE